MGFNRQSVRTQRAILEVTLYNGKTCSTVQCINKTTVEALLGSLLVRYFMSTFLASDLMRISLSIVILASKDCPAVLFGTLLLPMSIRAAKGWVWSHSVYFYCMKYNNHDMDMAL